MLRPLLLLASLILAGPVAAADKPAKQIFGAATLPAAMAAAPIGFYSRGCMAGAVALPTDGPTWQAMRLSRNRQWGLPVLVDFVERLSRDAARLDGWPGLLVGDMAQPRGGPMSSGHASHQVGLDADIWLTPMPSRRLSEREREDISAVPVTEEGPHTVHEDIWTPAHGRLIRRAALDPLVERIFAAPGIKKKLCETATGDRSWLRKVRPYYGHNYHFHVRLVCPPGTPCKAQAPVPSGEGCDADLDYWYTDAPYRKAPPPKKPPPPPRPVTLKDLPPACRDVVAAPPVPGAVTMRQAFLLNSGVGSAPAPQMGTGFTDPSAAAGSGADEAAALLGGNAAEGPEARLPRPRPGGY